MATLDPECPICGQTFEDGRGLNGHLRFKHGLDGEEFEEAMGEGMSRGRKGVTPAAVVEDESESVRGQELRLKGRLYEVEKKLEEIPFVFFSSEVGERKKELEAQRDRLKEKLSEI